MIPKAKSHLPHLLFSLPLIILLVYAAVAKLLVFRAFHRQLLHQPIPPVAADVLWPAIPASELLAAILMVFSRTRRTGLQLAFLLLFLFTGYVGLAWLHWWNRAACSCGGILGKLSWGWHLTFNVVFLLINVLALYQHAPEYDKRAMGARCGNRHRGKAGNFT